MLFDLHLATAMSGNMLVAPEELIDRALDLGLDGLGVAERNDWDASEVCVEFAEGLPLVIVRGVEIMTDLGEVLVYGLSDADFRSLVGAGDWMLADAATFVLERGGLFIPAHPFHDTRPSAGESLVALPGLSIIEGLNGRADQEANDAALDFAERVGLRTIGGSDALVLGEVGTCVTVFENPVATAEAVLEKLRAGRFAARHFAG
jgi:predicted metal-dependent phosphoesterase TrpH